jgi:hypothetical protein
MLILAKSALGASESGMGLHRLGLGMAGERAKAGACTPKINKTSTASIGAIRLGISNLLHKYNVRTGNFQRLTMNMRCILPVVRQPSR